MVSSRCIQFAILLATVCSAVCAMPMPLAADEERQVIFSNYAPLLNDALSADSDEEFLFDELEDDDNDGFSFIYSLFGGADGEARKEEQQQRFENDIQSAMMMVSSSSDDHVIEMAIISRAKQTFRRPWLFGGSKNEEEEQEIDLMSSDT